MMLYYCKSVYMSSIVSVPALKELFTELILFLTKSITSVITDIMFKLLPLIFCQNPCHGDAIMTLSHISNAGMGG